MQQWFVLNNTNRNQKNDGHFVSLLNRRMISLTGASLQHRTQWYAICVFVFECTCVSPFCYLSKTVVYVQKSELCSTWKVNTGWMYIYSNCVSICIEWQHNKKENCFNRVGSKLQLIFLYTRPILVDRIQRGQLVDSRTKSQEHC